MDKKSISESRELFIQSFTVSRETQARLDLYADLLEKWNEKINLVAKSTLPDLWQRHFADSSQLVPFIPAQTATIYDLGSGAGFPGLVLSIITGIPTLLLEADQRKCAFLQQVIIATKAPASVRNERIEQIDLPPASIITARALAELDILLSYAAQFWGKDSRALFLKGQELEKELTAARTKWFFDHIIIPSQTDPAGALCEIRNLRHV